MESRQIVLRSLQSQSAWMLFFSVVVLTSLFYSRYVLSIGMFGWLALSFFEESKGNWRFRLWYRMTGDKPAEKALSAFPLFFVLLLSSLLWSHWSDFGFSRIRLALPFIGLPLAFLHLPALNRKQIEFLWGVFIATATISSLYVLTQYFLVYDEAAIGQGQSILTPVNHIRYSLLMALASLLAFNLFYFRSAWSISSPIRWLFCLVSIGLALFTYFLSVRTGWVAWLAGFVILISHIGFVQQKIKFVLILLAVTAGLLTISYFSFSTVKEKIDYTFYDWSQFQKGKGWSTSDATRWRSIAIGGQIFLDHPYLGTGVGNIRKEAKNRFKDQYPKSSKTIMPHNQYVFWLATYGFLGFLLCLAIVIQPLGFRTARKEIGHLQAQSIFLLSFLVEATWQNSLGVGIYLAFTLLYLSYLSNSEKKEG